MARHGRRSRVLPQTAWQGMGLAGDASYNRDPITAQGISDAFIDAETLAKALATWLSGEGTFEDLLAAHIGAQRTREADVRVHQPARGTGTPPPEMCAFFAALRGNQDATNAFLCDHRRHSAS